MSTLETIGVITWLFLLAVICISLIMYCDLYYTRLINRENDEFKRLREENKSLRDTIKDKVKKEV